MISSKLSASPSEGRETQTEKRFGWSIKLGVVVLALVATLVIMGRSTTVERSNRVLKMSTNDKDMMPVRMISVENDEAQVGVKADVDSGLLVPFYRYYQGHVIDHFYTTNIHEIGANLLSGQVGNHGYTFEGVQSFISFSNQAGLAPLYRYYQPHVRDHFYTTNSHEIGAHLHPGQTGHHGYVYEGVAGYCSPHHIGGTQALYRYYQPHAHNHFYTTNPHEIGAHLHPGQTGNHGYVYEGIQCFVWSNGPARVEECLRLKENEDNDQDNKYMGAVCYELSMMFVADAQSDHNRCRTHGTAAKNNCYAAIGGGRDDGDNDNTRQGTFPKSVNTFCGELDALRDGVCR